MKTVNETNAEGDTPMVKWLYFEVWKHGQWIHLAKCQDTVENAKEMLKNDHPNRRYTIEDENERQAVIKIF